MKTSVKIVLWTIVTVLAFCCALTASADMFAQYEADNSMFPSFHDGELPLNFVLDVNEYYRPSDSFWNVPLVTSSSTRSRIPEIFLTLYVITLILLFVFLAYINSAKYRFAVTDRFRHIDLVVDASFDVMAVMNVATCEMDISNHKFVPRSVYGTQLSVVRENSQEYENLYP